MIGRTVLVVDDSPVNLELYSELLDMGGWRAVCLSEPDRLVSAVGDAEPALVLMDVNLAGSCGIQAGMELRSALGLAAPPMIAVTALRGDGLEKRLQEAGFLALLPKPCGAVQFLDAVAWGMRAGAVPFRVFRDDQ